MNETTDTTEDVETTPEEAPVALDRDLYMRSLIRELAGVLEDIVGVDDAAGYLSVVGTNVGQQVLAAYRAALATKRLTREQMRDVLVDLKRRVGSDFYVAAEDADRIVLANRTCPFGDKVRGRPSLCMMTSNIFGHIAAETTGYARVELAETIARGASGCRIVVHLQRDGEPGEGLEFFRRQKAQ